MAPAPVLQYELNLLFNEIIQFEQHASSSFRIASNVLHEYSFRNITGRNETFALTYLVAPYIVEASSDRLIFIKTSKKKATSHDEIQKRLGKGRHRV